LKSLLIITINPSVLPEFIETTHLPKALTGIIRESKEFVFLVSPFFKIHKEYFRMLESISKSNNNLEVKILFGKNEENKERSLSKEDLDLLKSLPNVDIRYEPSLHAKFYANEKASLISSLNFHAFSLANNIEVGVLLEKPLIRTGSPSAYQQSIAYFNEKFEAADVVYSKKNTSKTFLNFKISSSETSIDNSETVFGRTSKGKTVPAETKHSFKPGFCIRTGVPIPFNLEKPYSEKAFNSWAQFGNPDYVEKFCHFSGEKGETSMNKPILRKNWEEARKY
jgi:hypothetical protein